METPETIIFIFMVFLLVFGENKVCEMVGLSFWWNSQCSCSKPKKRSNQL